MAVTNNVLNAINVFSSTSVFNSNKGNVGANDLNFIKQTAAEFAAAGGGIITQSLGPNGYVKFANGLILQWGNFVNGTNYFPIAFPTALYSISAGGEANWGSGDVTIYKDPTTSSFYAERDVSETMSRYMATGI